MTVSRRGFIQVAAILPWSADFITRKLLHQDRVDVAVIGMGDEGLACLRALDQLEGVRIVALCDRDVSCLECGISLKQGHQLAYYQSAEQMLANRAGEAVIVATGESSLAVAAAASATGRDVYFANDRRFDPAGINSVAANLRRRRRLGQSGAVAASGCEAHDLHRLLAELGVTRVDAITLEARYAGPRLDQTVIPQFTRDALDITVQALAVDPSEARVTRLGSMRNVTANRPVGWLLRFSPSGKVLQYHLNASGSSLSQCALRTTFRMTTDRGAVECVVQRAWTPGKSMYTDAERGRHLENFLVCARDGRPELLRAPLIPHADWNRVLLTPSPRAS